MQGPASVPCTNTQPFMQHPRDQICMPRRCGGSTCIVPLYHKPYISCPAHQTLRQHLQDKTEALNHEVATWRLAADQAATVAERAQAQVGAL